MKPRHTLSLGFIALLAAAFAVFLIGGIIAVSMVIDDPANDPCRAAPDGRECADIIEARRDHQVEAQEAVDELLDMIPVSSLPPLNRAEWLQTVNPVTGDVWHCLYVPYGTGSFPICEKYEPLDGDG